MNKPSRYRDYIKKTFIKYTIITVLIIFSLYIISLFFSFKLTIVNENKRVNNELISLIGQEFNEYHQRLEALSNEDSIKNVFQDKSQLLHVNNLLYSVRNDSLLKANFVLLDAHGEIVTTNLYKDNQNELISTYFIQYLISKLDDDSMIERTLNESLFTGSQNSNYYFAKSITSSGKKVGYVIYFMEDVGDHLDHEDGNLMAITDKFDNAIYHSNMELVDHMGKLKTEQINSSTATFYNNLYFVTSNQIPNTSITVTNMSPIDSYKQSVLIGVYSLLGISIIIILLIFYVSPKLLKRNLESFDLLLASINKPESNNSNETYTPDTFEEFQIIHEQFNNKIAEIQLLIKRNEEISEKKRKMEIKHLETQFNPHFVFNVLEMLRYEILFDPENASEIVVSFANLMRYNINYGYVDVPLETDLKYVKDYLMLQKMRYDERLDYFIDVDQAPLKVKVPKLLIQPIIENSIKHCIDHTNHLNINISIKTSNHNLIISVEDNGQGMEMDQLITLQKSLADKDNPEEKIGLYNSHRIIQLLYGEDYGLSINSEPGIGTVVILKIPLGEI